MQSLLTLARNHAGRIAEFLIGLVGLWTLYILDHDLATGIITVPAEWQPYVPMFLGLASMAITMLTPQVLRLRTAALSADSTDPKVDGLAEQIVDAVVGALKTAPLPNEHPAVTPSVLQPPIPITH